MFRTPQKPRDQSCNQCKEVDTTEMVQCDECDAWYHYNCAGVTAAVETQPWKCVKCKGSAENGSLRSGKQKKTATVYSKSSSQRRQVNLELQRLETERAEHEKQYQERKLQLLEKADRSVARSSLSGASAMTKAWVSKIPSHPEVPQQIQLLPHSQFAVRQSISRELPIFTGNPEDLTKAWVSKIPSHPEVPQQIQLLPHSQLAARQSMSRELPIFTGDPEEWPLFYSSFQESNKLCGYTDAENLLRLQKCLKGKALEAVRSHLMLPKNVDEVLRTLKMMFGRPEIIICNILAKIRAEAPPKADKLETLVIYAISVRNLCSTIEASGLEAHMTNPLLLQELVDKLPAQIKLNWAMYSINQEASICSFSKWLFDVAEAVTKVSPNIVAVTKTNGSLHKHEEEKPSPKSACVICNASHLVDTCHSFAKMKLSDRWEKVKQLRLCRICLQEHGNFRCSDLKCEIQGCEARHHKLLHNFSQKPTVVTAHTSESNGNKTFFKIVPVILHNKDRRVETFAFLDDGSNVTLLEKGISDQLGLRGERQDLCLKWTSDTTRNEKGSMQVNLQISQRHPNAKKFDILNAHTVNNLALPKQSVRREEIATYPHLRNIPLELYDDAVPQILIGLNNGYVSNSWKIAEGNQNDPCASKTRLGWVTHGGGDKTNNTVGFHKIEECECASDMKKLHEIVSDYLSLEDVGRRYELKSPEDARADQILQSTTKRIGKQFETGLLWKGNITEVPNSYPMAMKRLTCLERKLDPEHIPMITQQIHSLVDKGYARKLSAEEVRNNHGVIWYLPIFTVVNPNKPGKVRLV